MGETAESCRAPDWEPCDRYLVNLIRLDPQDVRYHLYADHVALRKLWPSVPGWDGATDIETK